VKYNIRRLLAWILLGQVIVGVVLYSDEILATLRGSDSDCLVAYALPPVEDVVESITGQVEEAVWVVNEGELYLFVRSGPIEVCAVGEPSNPTFKIVDNPTTKEK